MNSEARVVEAEVEIELFAALPANTDKATVDAINIYLADVAIQIARTFFVPKALMADGPRASMTATAIGPGDGRD